MFIYTSFKVGGTFSLALTNFGTPLTSHILYFLGIQQGFSQSLQKLFGKRDPQKISAPLSVFSSIHDVLMAIRVKHKKIKSVRREIQGLTARAQDCLITNALGGCIVRISGTRTLIHVPQNLKNAGGLQNTFRDRR